jgi:hypothetical protein
MTPHPTPLDPGSMTVPPWFGWEYIVVVLALVALVAAAWLVIAAARGPVNERSEWQAWLAARSSRGVYSAQNPQDPPAERIHPSRLGPPSGAAAPGADSEDPDPALLRRAESTT